MVQLRGAVIGILIRSCGAVCSTLRNVGAMQVNVANNAARKVSAQNALKTNGSIPEGYTINHLLTDSNAWFLKTDVPNGLKHFVRVPLATSMDTDFDTGNQRFKARERYSFGCSDSLGMFGSPGSA